MISFGALQRIHKMDLGETSVKMGAEFNLNGIHWLAYMITVYNLWVS
jgi:hypothetical protein